MKTFFANLFLRCLNWSIANSPREARVLMKFVSDHQLTTPCIHGPMERLSIAGRVSQANTLFNTRSGRITIGTGVMFGHNCMVLTGFHDYSKRGETRERVVVEDAGRDIVIEEGAWIASGVVLIGPCTIGKNAVVAAGSVVVSDIPTATLAAGNPARVIRQLTLPDASPSS